MDKKSIKFGVDRVYFPLIAGAVSLRSVSAQEYDKITALKPQAIKPLPQMEEWILSLGGPHDKPKNAT